jgi:hypothetical protein
VLTAGQRGRDARTPAAWFDRVAAHRIDVGAAPPHGKGVHIACGSFTTRAIFLDSVVDGRAVFVDRDGH